MKVEELLYYAKSKIHSDYAKILLAELLGFNPLELLNHLDMDVDHSIVETYHKEVDTIVAGKPLQYAMGYVNFYGSKFIVNENVLIPRPETEYLVERTYAYLLKYFKEPISLIDLGCGSGVIGLTLKKFLKTAKVDLIDISAEALKVTRTNAKNLNLDANIYLSDMLDSVTGTYDLIISNPPYIKNNEEIEQIVKDNEPHLALYGGEDGLDCYRKIISNLAPHLKERALVAFEIGSDEGPALTKLIKETLPNVTISVEKDLTGRDRLLFILKNIDKEV
jgi:release factor glutamine methyltransferase